eukprot:GHVP01048913.1.p1 GENE.GHVP01048913.1~~GHVP01048913.1.p1  ORF type:complete len:467 (+),score=45.21 GHVP01048913.1:104-1504(+)
MTEVSEIHPEVAATKEDIDIEDRTLPGRWASSPASSHGDEEFRLPSEEISTSLLASLTSFNFPYGFVCGSMGLMVLPTEATRLHETHQSIALGISLGIVGLSQLVCPIAGKLSDSYIAKTQWGQRKPFLLYGTLFACLSVLGMIISSTFYWRYVYYLFLFSGMAFLNVVYSVQCGLVPDFVQDSSSGRSSGLVAVHAVAGSALGFLTVIATSVIDYHMIYPVIITFCCLSIWLVFRTGNKLENSEAPKVGQIEFGYKQSANESSLSTAVPSDLGHHGYDDVSEAIPTIHSKKILPNYFRNVSLQDLGKCFFIDTSCGYDFLWVFCSRTTYYVGVSVQAFILYYLRDLLQTPTIRERRIQLGVLALLAQTTAATVAYPVGLITDRGLNKKTGIFAASFLMSITYIGFMIAPHVGSWPFGTVLLSAFSYGLGNGCFLAVDYALALATLPNKSQAAQALGIWGVSAFIG